jgi:hypothetical protein
MRWEVSVVISFIGEAVVRGAGGASGKDRNAGIPLLDLIVAIVGSLDMACKRIAIIG